MLGAAAARVRQHQRRPPRRVSFNRGASRALLFSDLPVEMNRRAVDLPTSGYYFGRRWAVTRTRNRHVVDAILLAIGHMQG